MTAKAPNLNEACRLFLNALHDYQRATMDMNIALSKLTEHTRQLYPPLLNVVRSSNALIGRKSG